VKQVASLASWAARTQHATNFSAFLWSCRVVVSKQLQQPRKKTEKLTPPESAAQTVVFIKPNLVLHKDTLEKKLFNFENSHNTLES